MPRKAPSVHLAGSCSHTKSWRERNSLQLILSFIVFLFSREFTHPLKNNVTKIVIATILFFIYILVLLIRSRKFLLQKFQKKLLFFRNQLPNML
ncbi:MAG: DUF2101 family protein [Bacteroidetes bacterium]|nr:DUF2101 family protein [Bacteroidota bacterium]